MFPDSQSVVLAAAFRSTLCVVLKACLFYSFKQDSLLLDHLNEFQCPYNRGLVPHLSSIEFSLNKIFSLFIYRDGCLKICNRAVLISQNSHKHRSFNVQRDFIDEYMRSRKSDLQSGRGCSQYILLGLVINQIQLANGLSSFQVQAHTHAASIHCVSQLKIC